MLTRKSLRFPGARPFLLATSIRRLPPGRHSSQSSGSGKEPAPTSLQSKTRTSEGEGKTDEHAKSTTVGESRGEGSQTKPEETPDKGKDKKHGLGDELTLPRVVPPIAAFRPLAGLVPVFRSRLVDAGLTTFIGLGIVMLGGFTYLKWYKKKELDKIELAFAEGYDPALEVAEHAKRLEKAGHAQIPHLRRKEQDQVDRIVAGEETGHYYMLLGSKGSGKTTMIYDAMRNVNALGVVVCEAHPNLEVFRLRLGRVLNYEYNEDSQTGLFFRREQRQGQAAAGAALDIERAMSKLEKVALRTARKLGRPLVLIFNNVHFFQHTEEGKNVLLQLQQRAEAWAASGILTMVFSADDFWPFFVLRKSASRMHVLSIYDLTQHDAMHATQHLRASAGRPAAPTVDLHRALALVGGRLSHINRVARSPDVLATAQHMLALEKGWLQSQIGLIPGCDEDVLDEQKWSAYSWLLLREFVRLHKLAEQSGAEAAKSGQEDRHDFDLPQIPYWRCRQLLTRTDFIDELDRSNIIAVDVHHNVRPDSLLILQAAREVVEEEGFDEQLSSVLRRIEEIESLRRTREIMFKDAVRGKDISMDLRVGPPRLV